MICNAMKIRYTDKTETVVASNDFFPASVDDRPLTSSISGETLGFVLYDHFKASRMVYAVTLLPDTVRPQRAFLRDFFAKWRRIEIQFDDGAWIDVVMPRGLEPRELMNGLELAPKYVFTFTERAGSVA